MGSWSVNCGLSNITITAGNKCVLLPLKPSEIYNSYLPHLPATLPIFGEYDDYGGLENIEINDNTKLIETHFNCTINDFCKYFTRGCIDKSDISKCLSKNKEIQDWTFMFIDRKVYDFLSSMENNADEMYNFGNPELLKYLGAKHLGNIRDKRYNDLWELNGEKFKSDGVYLQNLDNKTIYSVEDLKYVLSEDKIESLKQSYIRLWNIYSQEYQANNFWWIIGIKSSYIYEKKMQNIIEGINDQELLNKLTEIDPEIKSEKQQTLAIKYVENFNMFGNYFADLLIIRNNIHCFSGIFRPHVQYVTPQCGEHSAHQQILEKFAEINKSYIDDKY